MKVLTIEVKIHFCVFYGIFVFKLCLKWIASDASEEKNEKN